MTSRLARKADGLARWNAPHIFAFFAHTPKLPQRSKLNEIQKTLLVYCAGCCSQHSCCAVGCGQNARGGNASAKVLIPHESWNCGMPDGIPAPESGSLIFEIAMKFDKVLDVGKTPFGDRKVIVAQEGTLSGPKLTGTVMPGALDFELKLSNGTIEVEQIFVLKTDDGKYVYVRNAGTGADSNDVRVVMDFEAPNAAPSAWLNSGKYVSRREVNVAAKTLTIRVYDVSSVSLPLVLQTSRASTNLQALQISPGIIESHHPRRNKATSLSPKRSH